jgi:hypothetical protein
MDYQSVFPVTENLAATMSSLAGLTIHVMVALARNSA